MTVQNVEAFRRVVRAKRLADEAALPADAEWALTVGFKRGTGTSLVAGVGGDTLVFFHSRTGMCEVQDVGSGAVGKRFVRTPSKMTRGEVLAVLTAFRMKAVSSANLRTAEGDE